MALYLKPDRADSFTEIDESEGLRDLAAPCRAMRTSSVAAAQSALVCGNSDASFC